MLLWPKLAKNAKYRDFIVPRRNFVAEGGYWIYVQSHIAWLSHFAPPNGGAK